MPVKRGTNFSTTELETFLEFNEEHLPIGQMEWETVEQRHSLLYPEQQRTIESLKRKFRKLYNTKAPTGNPNIPPHIRKAKELKQKINDRAEVSDGEDDEEVSLFFIYSMYFNLAILALNTFRFHNFLRRLR
jgi:hypothetical protein